MLEKISRSNYTHCVMSDEVIELEQPTNKLKLSVSHACDRCHFISKDQEGTLSKKYVPQNIVLSMKLDMLIIQRST